MLFQYRPPPHQRPWTNIETTLGQVLVFPERAVGIWIHACRLCLAGTGYTEFCVCIVLFCSPSLFSVLFCCVMSCCFVLFFYVLFCSTVLFCSVFCVLFCSVLFCSVLFCSVLFCSVLFCSVLFPLLFSSLLFSSLLFSSLLFSVLIGDLSSHRVIRDQTRYPSATNAQRVCISHKCMLITRLINDNCDNQ